jgi:hypothetical protein
MRLPPLEKGPRSSRCRLQTENRSKAQQRRKYIGSESIYRYPSAELFVIRADASRRRRVL